MLLPKYETMSKSINIYYNSLTDDLIPQIFDRLNEHETVKEINPVFSFKNPNGFLPIVFQWENPSLELFRDKDINRSFNVYNKPFDLKAFKRSLFKKKVVQQTFIQKLFKKKKKVKYEAIPLDVAIENQLKNYNKVLTIKYFPGDAFENKHATLFAAIVTELCGGLCYFGMENIWYNHKNIMGECLSKLYNLDELPAHINRKPKETILRKAVVAA